MLKFYIILLAFYLSTSIIQDNEKFEEFLEYTKKFNKKYSSTEELHQRFKNWKKNYNIVKRSNPISPKQNYLFEQNEFSDMSQEEFAEKYLTLETDSYRDLLKVTGEDLGLESVEAPESFDWEFDGKINATVKHQQNCGACWAFVATGTLEAQYQMKYKEKIVFSEQQLIDCSEENYKCRGGNMRKAYAYLQDNGLMKEEDYPYINGEGECKYNANKTVIKVTEYSFIPKNEEEMKKALYKYGPLAGAINGIAVTFYKKGIFEPWFANMCPNTISHAVVIMGYGIDRVTGKKYWRIKNSFGPNWGEDGYMRLIRDANVCGIANYNLIGLIEKVNK